MGRCGKNDSLCIISPLHNPGLEIKLFYFFIKEIKKMAEVWTRLGPCLAAQLNDGREGKALLKELK